MKITFDKKNYRKHSEQNKKRIRKSLTECGAGRSVLVDKDGCLIAGNGVYEQAEKMGIKTRVVETDGTELVVVKRTDIGTDDPKRKTLALADNATSDSVEWDMENIAANFELGDIADDWGVVFDEGDMRKLFESRMAAGEDLSEDEDYAAFVEKFGQKKTTDDCYTPDVVYDAVADWVASEYGVKRENFVRPFYPNGDYQREKYKSTDVVVDNPPFSILSEIIRFYTSNGIRFFLFAPHLTLFWGVSSEISALVTGVAVTYENGAQVSTSFLTNLEPHEVRFRSAPKLYQAVKIADDEYRKSIKKQLPKYTYPKHVVMSTTIAPFSRLGIDFVALRSETAVIRELDCQKESGAGIYGSGYLLSDRLANELEKAEREKAEREKAFMWKLSERELGIIASLSVEQDDEERKVQADDVSVFRQI